MTTSTGTVPTGRHPLVVGAAPATRPGKCRRPRGCCLSALSPGPPVADPPVVDRRALAFPLTFHIARRARRRGGRCRFGGRVSRRYRLSTRPPARPFILPKQASRSDPVYRIHNSPPTRRSPVPIPGRCDPPGSFPRRLRRRAPQWTDGSMWYAKPQVKGYFRIHRVIHDISELSTESACHPHRHPPRAHRDVHTMCATEPLRRTVSTCHGRCPPRSL